MLKSVLPILALVLAVTAAVPLLSLGAQQNTPTPAPALNQEPPVAVAPAAPVKNPVKPTAESQAKAKSLYQIDCAMCHGDNGNGKTDLATSMSLSMADWTDPKTLANKQDGELFNIIRNGKDKMPPEAEGRAKDVEVWNLIIYIRSFAKGQPAPASPAN
jgi:mono/diheme cytochrome c family protein